MRKLLAPLAIVGLVGLLVSCGGDDSDVTPATDAATTEETTTEAPAEEATDIVAIASGNEDFSTLVAAVAAAGLAQLALAAGNHGRHDHFLADHRRFAADHCAGDLMAQVVAKL